VDLKTVWDGSEPTDWRRAATDWRGRWADEQAASHPGGRAGLAAELGYASVSKLGTLIGDWRALTAMAHAGDPDAQARVRRAETFGRMIDAD
jgi:hypothetical protein